MYLYHLILGTIREKIHRLLRSSCIRHNEGTKVFQKQQLTVLFAGTASIGAAQTIRNLRCYFFLSCICVLPKGWSLQVKGKAHISLH